MVVLQGMLRRFPLVVLALAVWFAAEPLIHTHPVRTNAGPSSATCTVCSTGVAAPAPAPAVPAPQHVVSILDDAPAFAGCAAATLLLASRAPPAA
jgi:hypothetical protein